MTSTRNGRGSTHLELCVVKGVGKSLPHHREWNIRRNTRGRRSAKERGVEPLLRAEKGSVSSGSS